MIFRPSIAFDNGGISFAFEPNQTYEVLIPGANQGDAGPFIRSVSGNPNRSRLACSVQTTEGIADIVPGNPVVEVEVDVVTSFDANNQPLATERRPIQDTNGDPAVDVSRFSKVYFAFNELMFLPTVADNGTGSRPSSGCSSTATALWRPPAPSGSTSPAASRSSSTRSR